MIGAASYWSRGGSLPNSLGLEILAQAAARLLAADAPGNRLLVGVEEAEFFAPGLPVGVAWARLEPVLARGGLVKARAELLGPGGVALARATLLLAG